MRRLQATRRIQMLALASGLLLLPTSAQAQHATQHGSVPALYATQADAEQAARLHFNCTGAHRHGDQWMPCSNHSD